jgi:polyphosphate kinase
MMGRNLDNRSEVVVPVYDKKLQRMLKGFIDVQFSDNSKLRIIDAGQRNKYRRKRGSKNRRAQTDIIDYLRSFDY